MEKLQSHKVTPLFCSRSFLTGDCLSAPELWTSAFFICCRSFFLIAACFHDRDRFTSPSFLCLSYCLSIHIRWLHLFTFTLPHTGTHSACCSAVQQQPVQFQQHLALLLPSPQLCISLTLLFARRSHFTTHTHTGWKCVPFLVQMTRLGNIPPTVMT